MESQPWDWRNSFELSWDCFPERSDLWTILSKLRKKPCLVLLGSGVTVEFWETAATYRLKDAHLGQAGWWGQGYLDPLTPRGEDSAVFTLVFFLPRGEWLRGTPIIAAGCPDSSPGSSLWEYCSSLFRFTCTVASRPGYPCLSTVTAQYSTEEKRDHERVPLGW